MLDLAQVKASDVVYDLGSGDGRIVITAAKKYGARGVGIEIDPALVKLATERAAAAGVSDRVRFVTEDLFAANISDATVVTLYLLQSINERLRPKLVRELKPGTRVVSHVFNMGPEWPPEKTIEAGPKPDLSLDDSGPIRRSDDDGQSNHRRREGCRAGASDARARRDGGRRRLRPGDRRSVVPGRRVGHGQRTDLRPADAHERRGERHGQRRRRACAALEDSRHPARRAAHQERRHHRGAPGEGHRQVREARRRHRRSAAGDQSARHDGQHGHQRDQVQGRRHLLAASDEPEHGARNRARASRGARRSRARPRI